MKRIFFYFYILLLSKAVLFAQADFPKDSSIYKTLGWWKVHNESENITYITHRYMCGDNVLISNSILNNGEFAPKVFRESDGFEYTIYLKDGEEISKTLALLGANKSVLKFEEIRVKREMNNKVNRLVNCETANMNKTMNASIEQIEIIRKLKQNGKFEKLEEPLKEIAELRLQNPSASLIELGKMLKTPIGKSGVNYRLKKVMEIGKKIDDNKK